MTTGDDLIAFAGSLAARPAPASAAVRAAASRAYYGAFHLAGELLRELGFSLNARHNRHQILIDSGQVEARSAGQLLSTLQSDRVQADYRLDEVRAEAPAFGVLSVERAREVQSLLVKCSHEPTRSAVIAGIELVRQRRPELFRPTS